MVMIQRRYSLILGLGSLRSYPPNLFVPTCALLILSVLFSTIAQPAMPSKGGGPQGNIHPSLDLSALTGPLQELTPEERKVVDETVELIRQKRHTAALLNLSRLIGSNPQNSALRVLRAYVLLEVGNVSGALDEARSAEASGVRSAYRCWFLAQVAYLAGNVPLCRREIKHIGSDVSYGHAAEALRRRVETGSK
jgi:hypothetical protein